MKRLVIANWKMNLNPGEASLLAGRLDQNIHPHASTDVVLCAPAIDLYPLAKELNRKTFKLGAQNAYHLDEGPFTGEVSAAMLRGLVDYVIIGHSERRAMGEDDKLIALKVAAALRNGLTPILCVGENLHDREHNLTTKVVAAQVEANLAHLTDEDVAKIVIAYEPIWAINHHDGHPVQAATPDHIKPAYRAIRTTIEELYGEQAAAGQRILYGGSANGDNCRAFIEMDYCDGLLVGTASLNYAEFSKMVKIVQDFDRDTN